MSRPLHGGVLHGGVLRRIAVSLPCGMVALDDGKTLQQGHLTSLSRIKTDLYIKCCRCMNDSVDVSYEV